MGPPSYYRVRPSLLLRDWCLEFRDDPSYLWNTGNATQLCRPALTPLSEEDPFLFIPRSIAKGLLERIQALRPGSELVIMGAKGSGKTKETEGISRRRQAVQLEEWCYAHVSELSFVLYALVRVSSVNSRERLIVERSNKKKLKLLKFLVDGPVEIGTWRGVTPLTEDVKKSLTVAYLTGGMPQLLTYFEQAQGDEDTYRDLIAEPFTCKLWTDFIGLLENKAELEAADRLIMRAEINHMLARKVKLTCFYEGTDRKYRLLSAYLETQARNYLRDRYRQVDDGLSMIDIRGWASMVYRDLRACFLVPMAFNERAVDVVLIKIVDGVLYIWAIQFIIAKWKTKSRKMSHRVWKTEVASHFQFGIGVHDDANREQKVQSVKTEYYCIMPENVTEQDILADEKEEEEEQDDEVDEGQAELFAKTRIESTGPAFKKFGAVHGILEPLDRMLNLARPAAASVPKMFKCKQEGCESRGSKENYCCKRHLPDGVIPCGNMAVADRRCQKHSA
ncbi:hypothetical protein SELMODRAFT_417891 [Selaginella moellendorffii]|uniref:Uncharacterized protein n=1 Tax=Selaginella moellendorffii TaxID=88036 RepID=D8S400_SELML|nr:hypothetical protein SELMODRAFT_417891 [Selaginella moellendorffii]